MIENFIRAKKQLGKKYSQLFISVLLFLPLKIQVQISCELPKLTTKAGFIKVGRFRHNPDYLQAVLPRSFERGYIFYVEANVAAHPISSSETLK